MKAFTLVSLCEEISLPEGPAPKKSLHLLFTLYLEFLTAFSLSLNISTVEQSPSLKQAQKTILGDEFRRCVFTCDLISKNQPAHQQIQRFMLNFIRNFGTKFGLIQKVEDLNVRKCILAQFQEEKALLQMVEWFDIDHNITRMTVRLYPIIKQIYFEQMQIDSTFQAIYEGIDQSICQIMGRMLTHEPKNEMDVIQTYDNIAAFIDQIELNTTQQQQGFQFQTFQEQVKKLLVSSE